MSNSAVIELNTQIHDRVIELLQAETRGNLLDVGAGDGTLAERLRDEGFDVTAIDLFTADFRPDDIRIKSADLNEGIPFPDGNFQVLVTTEVIEHLENPWFFVRELYRVTKPGGLVILSTPNLDSVYARIWYALTGRLYNFMESSYRQIGHITPVFLWNMERMIEDKFDLESAIVNASPVPKTPIRLPGRSRLFGQCIVMKLRRRPGPPVAGAQKWAESRIVRTS